MAKPTGNPNGRPSTCSGIYALAEDGIIKYVGQSKDIHKRYLQHCSLAQNRGNTKKNLWLYAMLLAERKPQLVILEKTSELDQRECYWIAYYRKQNLSEMNMADGATSYNYAERSKETNPWGKKWSPVRRTLNLIQDTIKTHRRFGNQEDAVRLEKKLTLVNKAIKKVGLNEMNAKLWERNKELYERQ